MTEKHVLAIVVSDLHLSHEAPSARAAEPDWYAAMGRRILELESLTYEHKRAELFYAGDIFDKWKQPPALLSFCLDNLPHGKFVAGQHDMPYHDANLLHCSAFGVLTRVDGFLDISGGRFTGPKYSGNQRCGVYGVEWGSPTPKIKDDNAGMLIAIVHRYCWMEGGGHPGATIESSAASIANEYSDFDFVVLGDNHAGGVYTNGKTTVINCGAFMWRKSDEVKYRPRAVLIYGDGSYGFHEFDTSQDLVSAEYVQPEIQKQQIDQNVREFVQGLSGIVAEKCSFVDAVERYCDENSVPDRLRDIILKATQN